MEYCPIGIGTLWLGLTVIIKKINANKNVILF